MKILITGATGFLGVNLIKYLRSSVETELEFVLPNRKLLELLDVEDLNGIDSVIHLAGKAHDLKKTSSVEEYYKTNTELTEKMYKLFLNSKSSTFIFISSVKAISDMNLEKLTEDTEPNPKTHYGKSKLLAEKFIINQNFPKDKSVFILRPCMIHGPGNKGNLNLLYQIANKKFPWPLGAFNNLRSFCSIDNLCFIIKELIERKDIASGIYNVADDDPLSTNELIKLIAEANGKKARIWDTPKKLIYSIAKIGDIIRLPINTERLNKLTETYIVSNFKIKNAIKKPFPISSKDGLMKTLKSFQVKFH